VAINYVKHEKISLKNNPEFNETQIQGIIANDPSILGLGDLILKDKERIQPHAGRLDLLLQDEDSTKRWEVEVQLGKTDESHIIRTIEYWDIEKKRYPQYDHCAVIIAEDITSRFLNVISLFHGAIPLIAIQMCAVKVGDKVSLIFTKVLDQTQIGLIDEDEEESELTDRNYWEQLRGTKKTVSMADDALALINSFAPGLSLKYNKFYIGLARDGQPDNFVIFRPQRNAMRLELRIAKSDDVEKKIDAAGLVMLDYDARWGRYRLKLDIGDVKKHEVFLTELLKLAVQEK